MSEITESKLKLKVNRKYQKAKERADGSRKIRWISEDKLDDIRYPEEELHRAVCIRNTVDLLVEIEERARRWNRCRQKIHALSKRQDVLLNKVDDAAEKDKVAVTTEVDVVNNDLSIPPSNV